MPGPCPIRRGAVRTGRPSFRYLWPTPRRALCRSSSGGHGARAARPPPPCRGGGARSEPPVGLHRLEGPAQVGRVWRLPGLSRYRVVARVEAGARRTTDPLARGAATIAAPVGVTAPPVRRSLRGPEASSARSRRGVGGVRRVVKAAAATHQAMAGPAAIAPAAGPAGACRSAPPSRRINAARSARSVCPAIRALVARLPDGKTWYLSSVRAT